MKLAETYYRQQDFPNAQTQFQILAQENPRAGFTEKALFFAAKSAMQSMGAEVARSRARLARRGGQKKWRAEMGRAERTGRHRAQTRQADRTPRRFTMKSCRAARRRKRSARHCAARATFFMSWERPTAKITRRAIEAYDQLASQKDVSAALAKSGALQKGHLSREIGRSRQCAGHVLQNHRGRDAGRTGRSGNFSGITKPALTRRGCSRMTRNGSLRPSFTRSSLQPAAREVTKRSRA